MNEIIKLVKEKADAAEIKLNDSIHEIIEVHLKQSNDEQTQRIVKAVTESNEALQVSIRGLQEAVFKAMEDKERLTKRKSILPVVHVILDGAILLAICSLIFLNR